MSGTDEVVVAVLEKLLGRTKADIREDPRRYAAFFSDDMFWEALGATIDWKQFQLPAADESSSAARFYGRTDFDLAASLCDVEAIDSSHSGMGPLAALQDRLVSGEFSPADLGEAFVGVEMRIDVTGSLVEAATAMFLLREGPVLTPDEYWEIDPEWAALLGAFDSTLVDHLGWFFQSPSMARSTGGMPVERLLSVAPNDSTIETVAQIQIGEHQGSIKLCRV